MIVRVTPVEELRALLNGFRISAAISVAAELDLSDHLADGPRTVADLAEATSTDEATLHRLLHALSTIDVYAEQPDGSFAIGRLGDGLRSGVPGSMRPFARTLTYPETWAAWGHLGHSVRTGENAFKALTGVDVWTRREQMPEANALFNEYMTTLSSHVAAAVSASYDFTGRSSVVDVGGGQGIVLEAVLAGNDHLTGTVFDMPHVVAKAPRPGASESVAARWAATSGSFFESVPPADVYILKSILHDWPDDRCVDILRTCRRSLTDGGVVLVVETLLGKPGFEAEAAFSDLNMLVLPGGQERTADGYAGLFVAADLRLARTIHTGTRFAVLEATAA
jgi:O-methyltransferase domain/Dimerisation domain